jgi:hypothetical protein
LRAKDKRDLGEGFTGLGADGKPAKELRGAGEKFMRTRRK